MFKKFKFSLQYKIGDEKFISEKLEGEHYSIKYNCTENGIVLSIIPKVKLELVKSSIIYDYKYEENDRVFVNGYQSWTTSREYKKNDIQKGLVGPGKIYPIKNLTVIFGDYKFAQYSKNSGFFHSFTYGYVRKNDECALFGSLSERQGYTILYYDMNASILTFDKDVEGVTIGSEYELYSLYAAKGSYNDVFDKYFAAMGIKKPKEEFMCGYTSWYNYFGKISEKIAVRDLEGMFSKVGSKADIFQIDDGYQTAVGDWLSVREDKFPSGMKYIADKIHSYGYKAGIWLAPFSAQFSSKVTEEHPDWLVKNKKGKPIKGSIAWGGAYTIDFYVKEAADYIRNFFDGILNGWGYDLVKLDFLYSICMEPRYNKSRGQIMCEAMDFLRDCVGEKYILGCGVPLAPSFGKVDFCRISCDVELVFPHRFYADYTNQEIVSAKNAMNNTIFRRHLSGRAFANDPDVFFLRENDLTEKDELFVKKGKLRFTAGQKELLAKINNMCGNVLFVSDNIGDYGEEQMRLLNEAFTLSKLTVIDAEYEQTDIISIKYLDGTNTYKLEFNTVTGENSTIKI